MNDPAMRTAINGFHLVNPVNGVQIATALTRQALKTYAVAGLNSLRIFR